MPRPRNPRHNPTERILGLLADTDELLACYEALWNKVSEVIPDLLNDQPSPPPMVAFHVEMQRQNYDYSKPRADVLRSRNRMRQMRDTDAALGFKQRERVRQQVPRIRTQKSEFLPDNPADINERVSATKREDDRLKLKKLGIDLDEIAPGNNYKPSTSANMFSKTKPEEE